MGVRSSTLSGRSVPYPAIGAQGVIGDRRTAALVAADGTIAWLCLPDYDGDIVFGALLDHAKGGHWKLGPAAATQGAQRYGDNTATLRTTWELDDARLELTDAMAWPGTARPREREHQRVIIRRLRCNGPLLFSQMEYVRAVTELAKARPLSSAMLAIGMAATSVRRAIGRWIGKDR